MWAKRERERERESCSTPGIDTPSLVYELDELLGVVLLFRALYLRVGVHCARVCATALSKPALWPDYRN